MSGHLDSLNAMPFVTVVQFGGNWAGMQVNPDDGKLFVTSMKSDEKSAQIAAKHFAMKKGFVYQDRALKFNQPLMTIWKVQGHWVPAKNFDDHIVACSTQTCNREEAKQLAKFMAWHEQLECFPSLGESASTNRRLLKTLVHFIQKLLRNI